MTVTEQMQRPLAEVDPEIYQAIRTKWSASTRSSS